MDSSFLELGSGVRISDSGRPPSPLVPNFEFRRGFKVSEFVKNWNHGFVDIFGFRFGIYRGTSPMRKRPLPYDPLATLGIGLRQGSREVRFFRSKVPL